MPCKHYEQDLAVIVRCKFTDSHVCKQWLEADPLLYAGIDEFCEKQSSRTFVPEPITEEDRP